MPAIAALEQLLTVNRNAAILLFTGIGVFAAISIVGTYEIDYTIALRVAAYILGFATASTVLSVVVDNTLIRSVLGWFVVGLFMFWSLALSISVVFQPGPLPPPYCLVYFLQDCDEVAEAIALKQEQRTGSPVIAVHPPPVEGDGVLANALAVPTAEVPAQTVYVQFAGILTRDSVRTLMLTLEAQGWNVQGAAQGGERTNAAAGYNEVRFSGDSRAAAQQLAAELERFNLTGRPITVVENPDIDAGTLEVWLSVT